MRQMRYESFDYENKAPLLSGKIINFDKANRFMKDVLTDSEKRFNMRRFWKKNK